MAVSPINLLV